jgi:hypothetical protein
MVRHWLRLAIETICGEMSAMIRLDPRRGTGLISKVGDDEVRSGASVHEYEWLTQPACNLRATLVGDGQREGYPCRGEWRVSRGRDLSIRPPVHSVTWLRRCAGPRTAQTHPVCPVWTRSVSGKGCKGGRVVCVARPETAILSWRQLCAPGRMAFPTILILAVSDAEVQCGMSVRDLAIP